MIKGKVPRKGSSLTVKLPTRRRHLVTSILCNLITLFLFTTAACSLNLPKIHGGEPAKPRSGTKKSTATQPPIKPFITDVKQQTPFQIVVRVRSDVLLSPEEMPDVQLLKKDSSESLPLKLIGEGEGFISYSAEPIPAGEYFLHISGLGRQPVKGESIIVEISVRELIKPFVVDVESDPRYVSLHLSAGSTFSQPMVCPTETLDSFIFTEVDYTLPKEMPETKYYNVEDVHLFYDEEKRILVMNVFKSTPQRVDYSAGELVEISDKEAIVRVPTGLHLLDGIEVSGSSVLLYGDFGAPSHISYKGKKLALILANTVSKAGTPPPGVGLIEEAKDVHLDIEFEREIKSATYALVEGGTRIKVALIPPPAVVEYTPTSSFGTRGMGADQFTFPLGIDSDEAGRVVVADYGNNCIKVFNRDGSHVRTIGRYGTGGGELHGPSDVAIGSGNNLYVCDQNNNRIVVFNSAGYFVRSFGAYGRGPGELASPQGIAVDIRGNVYVTDMAHRVQVFTSEGRYLRGWGGLGSAAGKFRNPSGIAVDKSGYVYVADSGNKRVQKFDSSGHHLKSWSYIRGYGSLQNPVAVAVRDEIIWIADAKTQTVIATDGYNRLLWRVGGEGTTLGKWKNPTDLALAADGTLFVSDKYNNRIQILVGGWRRIEEQ